jgi:midasin (ATPase involved in ribosome maturation)
MMPGIKPLAVAGDTAPEPATSGPTWSRPRGEPFAVDPRDPLIRPNGERYLPRELGGHHDVAVLRRLRGAGLYALLAGEPGTGKTALAEAAFPELVAVPCHGDMTVAHLLGTHLPTPNGGWRWADGPLVQAMRAGLPLYLDEVNAMPGDVSTVLHSVMDGRAMVRIDDRPDEPQVTAAPGFYVLGSYNPGSFGGRRLSDALASRFAVQIVVSSDYEAARSLGVPAELVTLAENLAVKSASERDAGGAGVWTPQMRELLFAKQLVDAGFDLDFAAAAILAQCPWSEDVEVVRIVGEHVLGVPLGDLQLGPQTW